MFHLSEKYSRLIKTLALLLKSDDRENIYCLLQLFLFMYFEFSVLTLKITLTFNVD